MLTLLVLFLLIIITCGWPVKFHDLGTHSINNAGRDLKIRKFKTILAFDRGPSRLRMVSGQGPSHLQMVSDGSNNAGQTTTIVKTKIVELGATGILI